MKLRMELWHTFPVILALVCCGAQVEIVHAVENLIQNGSFELPAGGGGAMTSLPYWTVNKNIDVVWYWPAVDGQNVLDLAGTDGPGAYIQQTVPTVVGQTYFIQFFVANNPATNLSQAVIEILGQKKLPDGRDYLPLNFGHIGSTAANMNYQRVVERFIAETSTTTIRFTQLDSSQNANIAGVALDAVSLTAIYLPPSDLIMPGSHHNYEDHSFHDHQSEYLYATTFNDGSIQGANFAGAVLQSANFNRTDARDANLSFANLVSSSFVGAKLSGANLHAASLNNAILAGATVDAADLTSAVLAGANLDGASLYGANLSNANLQGASLVLTDLRHAQLQNYNPAQAISNIQLATALVSYANLSGNNLAGFDLSGGNLEGVNLSAANLSNAKLVGANLVAADFTGAGLAGAMLTNAVVANANFSGANLAGADLRNPGPSGAPYAISAAQLRSAASVQSVNLAGNSLPQSSLRGIDLTGSDLSATDLTGADLHDASLGSANMIATNLNGADLSNAYLWSANLASASLVAANFHNANLPGANMTGANLAQTSFAGANLWLASLKDTDLSSADFTGAYLWGANLDQARLPDVLPMLPVVNTAEVTVLDDLAVQQWAQVDAGGFLSVGRRAIIDIGDAQNQGGLYFDVAGTMGIDIGGFGPGNLHGQVNVHGIAVLNGNLLLHLVGDFPPQLGDSFDVLTYHLRVGTFANFQAPWLPGHVSFKPTYGAHALTVTVRPTVDGDINTDGVTNGQDLAVLASHWLQNGGIAAGDANGDQLINGQDIAMIASNWLRTDVNQSSAGGSSAAVPEPATGALALLAIAGLSGLRRRGDAGAKHQPGGRAD